MHYFTGAKFTAHDETFTDGMDTVRRKLARLKSVLHANGFAVKTARSGSGGLVRSHGS